MPTLRTILLRYALYAEGVRRRASMDFRGISGKLDADVARLLSGRKLDTMNRAEFNRLMVRVRKRLAATLSREMKSFAKTLEQTSGAHVTNYNRLFREVTGKRRTLNRSRIWGTTNARDLGATGRSMDATARVFQNAALGEIESRIRQGYANKTKTSDVLARMGTSSRKIGAWADSFADTSLGHVSAVAKHETSRRYYEEYDWISVLDEGTTEICRDRAGNRYRYGEGPIPPAHYRCRSEIVPVDPEDNSPVKSFNDWIEDQPAKFLSDVFKRGDRTLDNVKLITLDQLKDKLETVLS